MREPVGENHQDLEACMATVTDTTFGEADAGSGRFPFPIRIC